MPAPQALFVGRAVVDEVLPPAFLVSALRALPDGCLGVAVVQAAGKSCRRHEILSSSV